MRIDYRWARAMPPKSASTRAELVALAPDVILAHGSRRLAPLLQATRTVPIVFVQVPDPVGGGFVDSLARPGGNVTGFTSFEYGSAANGWSCSSRSRPRVTRVAVIRDAGAADRRRPVGRRSQAVAPSLAASS